MPPLADITNSSTTATHASSTTNSWDEVGWGSPVVRLTEDWGNLDFIFPDPPGARLDRAQADQLRVLGELNNWLNEPAPANANPFDSDTSIDWTPPRMSNLDMLAQLAPSPDPFRVPAPTHQLFQQRREMLHREGSPTLRWQPGDRDYDREHTLEDLLGWPDRPPTYLADPHANERTLVAARWDPYPIFDQQPRSNAARQRINNRRDNRRFGRPAPTTTTTARRTTNVAARLSHRRRALAFIHAAPLPRDFQEFDRLAPSQQDRAAFFFLVQEEIVPTNQAHPTVMHWRRTIIQEHEEALAEEWSRMCIECSLPVGPWCY